MQKMIYPAFTGVFFSLILTSLAFASDQGGEDIKQQKQQPRIVSAGAGVTELIVAMGAEDKLVGIDSTSQLPSKHVAQLGYHRMLSAEGIMALTPSHVIGSDVMGPESTLAILTQSNIAVIKLPSANTAEQLMTNIDTLGQILSVNDAHILAKAAALKSLLKGKLNAVAAKRKQLAKAPKVLFLLMQEGRPARIGGKGTAADLIIALAGGKNIAEFDSYKSLSQEGILALDPDIILLSSRSDLAQVAAFDEVISAMPLVAHTQAGKQQAFINLAPQALLGGLGLSAIDAADSLLDQFMLPSKNKSPL